MPYLYQPWYCPIILTALLWATPSFAGLSTYFCSAGHQYINLGDNASKVQTACGAPSRIEKNQPNAATTTNNNNTDQIWTYAAVTNPMTQVNTGLYYSSPNNPLRNGLNPSPFGNNNTNSNPYNAPTFQITFHAGLVSAVTGNPHQCGNWSPRVGVTTQTVLNRCGQPLSNQSTGSVVNPYTTTLETWIYTNPYGPPLQLQMTNGILSQISLGG